MEGWGHGLDLVGMVESCFVCLGWVGSWVVSTWKGVVTGRVLNVWGHGLCLGRVGSWVVSRMGGVTGCV